jgi:hypothetical protein
MAGDPVDRCPGDRVPAIAERIARLVVARLAVA